MPLIVIFPAIWRSTTGLLCFKRVFAMMPNDNPYLEGYIAAIRGNRNCPYDEGTTEWERWWIGFGAITG